MQAVQIRILMAFTLVVVLVVAWAATAVPAGASGRAASVSVCVNVARRVAISLPVTTDDVDPASLTRSNVDCETSAQWVERGGQRVWLVTVIPTR